MLSINTRNTESLTDDQRAPRGGGERESVAVPSNTATNNSINRNNENGALKFLRWGVDSLYLSYQGELYPHINEQLSQLKRQSQSEKQNDQAKAQLKVGEYLFEVKDI